MSQYGPPGGPYPGEQPDRWPEHRQPSEPYREPSDPWGGPPGPWGDAPTEAPGGQQWHGGAPPDWSAGQPPPAGPDWQGYGQHTSAGDQNWHSPAPPAQGWAGAEDQTWQQPGGGQQPYPDGGQQHPTAAPAWEPAAEPRRSGRGGGLSGGLLAVVIGLAVLLCGGGAAGVYLVTRDDTPDSGTELTAPTSEPDEAPSVPPSEQPEPTAGADEPSPTPTPTSSNDARFVDVGQCVRNEAEAEEETPVLTITDCDSGAYEVLARFDGVTDGEEDAKTKCADVEGYTNWYFFNSQLDALDFVLCLRQR